MIENKRVLIPVVGKFLVCGEDSDFVRDSDGQIMVIDGRAVRGEPYPIYFECGFFSFSQGWTKDVEKAFVFENLDDALTKISQQNFPCDYKIRTLK